MFWIVIAILLFVLAIGLFVISKFETGLYTLAVAAVVISAALPSTISREQQVSVYKQQYTYILYHKPVDNIENAALTNKKIELNDWLYEAQYMKDTYGFLSFYPSEVLELKPIQ